MRAAHQRQNAGGQRWFVNDARIRRFRAIKVQWQNEKFQTRFQPFTGWMAGIIQHEIDHCEGILI